MKGLRLRLTHRYVDEYKHLDDHELIGDYFIVSSESKDVEDARGCTGDQEQEIQVIVYSDRSNMDIINALYDEFRQWGCSHEYDCCGCQLIRVAFVEKQPVCDGFAFKSQWLVRTYVTHNY